MGRDLYSAVARLEREWMNAWCRQDLDFCAGVMADDFVMVTAKGRLVTKDQWLAAAGTRWKCEEFRWEDIRVRPFGRVVVVHARAGQTTIEDGADTSGTVIVTDVWLEREGAWQVVSRHVNRLV